MCGHHVSRVTMLPIMSNASSPLILAHRGVSSEFPENTVEAFTAAGPRGADGVELDVRRTADGVLVVHHDAHLDDGRAIVQVTHADLPDSVPTLVAALEACTGLVVNIEIKNFPGEPDYDGTGSVASGTVDTVRTMGLVDKVIVSGFNYDDIMVVRRDGPELATGWLVLAVDDVRALLDHIVHDGHRALHPPVEATTPEVIAAAHARGVPVNTWTVDDPARIAELVAAGVDAVITNDPATARRVVTEASEGA